MSDFPHETPTEIHVVAVEPPVDGVAHRYLATSPKPTFEVESLVRLDDAWESIEGGAHVVVLDLDHCGGGLDALRKIRRRFAIPVVVLTEKDDELGPAAIHEGAQDFLVKSQLDRRTLIRAVRFAHERNRLLDQMQSIVTSMSDALLILCREGAIRYANPAAEALLGQSYDELIGEPFGIPLCDSEPCEIQLHHPEGPRTVEMRVSELMWNGAPSFLASLRDVTDRKRADDLEKQLLHANRLASIGQLAAGVAHEVNNPAAFVRANLATLSKEIARLSDDDARVERMREMVSESLVGLDRIVRIVSDLRTFSRIERDEMEHLDLNEIVQVACNMTFNEVRHRAKLVQRPGRIPPVLGDRAKLAQVVTNLLLNAAQSIPDSNDGLEDEVRISTMQEGDRVVLVVEDTGGGIPDAARARIFEPFFTTKGDGTGLGLALTAEIVERHGGEIVVESETGKGTRFAISLPIAEIEMAGLAATAPSEHPEPVRARVLLIDDEVYLLRALSRVLESEHDVVTASGGEAACAILDEDTAFDVVVCDLMMPQVDGVSVYDKVREVAPQLVPHMLFCSGGAFTQRARDFLEGEGVVCLTKPVTPAQLLRAIETARRNH